MAVNETTKAVQMTTENADKSLFIRDVGKNAFDAACFHYSTYRSLMRFLGYVVLMIMQVPHLLTTSVSMDGDLSATGESPEDFVSHSILLASLAMAPKTGHIPRC